MQKNRRVADMAVEVLARQVGARVRRTGEPFEAALKAVLETEAGRQLAELRDRPHGDERAERWQEDLAHKRAQERKREQVEERQRAQEAAAWKLFMQEELRELEKRKSGQLAELLGEALPGEPSAALERLAYEDRRQAQDGLVALMSMGKVSYKHLDELSPKDMPARAAANRLRTTWLKERRDGWLARGLGGRT
jgi:Lon protease-like protein